MVKNPPASARDIRDRGLIPGSGRSPGGGMATHSSILAWTEETGALQFIRSQRVGCDSARTHDVTWTQWTVFGCCGGDYQLAIPMATPKTLPCCFPLL